MGALDGKIKTPFGEVSKKAAVIGGGFGAAILFIVYRRYQEKQAASSTAAAADTTDDTTADGSLDGSELAAEEAGYYGDDLGGSGEDIIGYDSEGNPVYGATTGSQSSNAYSTNADWTQAAVDALSEEGVDAQTATTAIANVLAGLTVTTAQQNLFLQAVGLLGMNPPDGYPTPIKTSDTSSDQGSGSSGNGNTTTSGGAASSLKTPSGLRVTAATKTSLSYTWTGVPGAQWYDTYATYQGKRISESRVTTAQRTIGGLGANRTYTLHVIAGNSKTESGDAQISHKTSA